jgi:hypothetical protein
MTQPPDPIPGFLALAAYFGLPLLIFVFQLGKLRVFWALLWTVFLCLVLGEFLGATFGGLLEEDFRRHPASLQTTYLFLCFFVLMTYGLILLRIYWLIRCARHRRTFRGFPGFRSGSPEAETRSAACSYPAEKLSRKWLGCVDSLR